MSEMTELVVVSCRFLSGCVEFLEQPAMAFVRLNEAVLLESVLEVPVPVRFIFVLLGPSQSNVDYHEIGRSFSTLMSDKVDTHNFKDVKPYFNLMINPYASLGTFLALCLLLFWLFNFSFKSNVKSVINCVAKIETLRPSRKKKSPHETH